MDEHHVYQLAAALGPDLYTTSVAVLVAALGFFLKHCLDSLESDIKTLQEERKQADLKVGILWNAYEHKQTLASDARRRRKDDD